jgi:hypothetical protein
MTNDKLQPWPKLANSSSGPRHHTITAAVRDLIAQAAPGDTCGRTYAEMIAAKLVSRALHGDLRAARELMQAVPEQYECPNCAFKNQIRQMSSEELRAIIRHYTSRVLHSTDSKVDEDGSNKSTFVQF